MPRSSRESARETSGRRLVARLLIAAVVVVALGGCAPTDAEPPPRSASATPSSTPTPTPISVMRTVRTTTAHGTFTGAVRGTVDIVADTNAPYRITITTTSVTGPRVRTVELSTSLADLDCSTANDSARPRTVVLGERDVTSQVSFRAAVQPSSYGDGSYLTVLVLAERSADTYCDTRTMGVAHLTWTRDPALAGLQAVDSGPIGRAEGEVTTTAGVPVAYEVAADDTLDAVSRRFGLTFDEVLYLNPRRERGTSLKLYTGEVLNLDPGAR